MPIQMLSLLVSCATMLTSIRPCIAMRDFMRSKPIGSGCAKSALIAAVRLVAIVPTHVSVEVVLKVKGSIAAGNLAFELSFFFVD